MHCGVPEPGGGQSPDSIQGPGFSNELQVDAVNGPLPFRKNECLYRKKHDDYGLASWAVDRLLRLPTLKPVVEHATPSCMPSAIWQKIWWREWPPFINPR